MRNFELIDDYLTNRLSDADKSAFESEVNHNTELQKELALQRMAIEGVKKARAAELKAMLNKVPVGGGANLKWASTLKIAAGVVGAGLLIAGLSHYFSGKEHLNPTDLSTSVEDSIKKSEPQPSIEEPQESPKNEGNTPPVEAKEEEKKLEARVWKEGTTKVEQAKPKIEVVDPTAELTENAGAEKNKDIGNNRTQVAVSHIAVETDATNKKYSFHYQFANGKLHLYGDFNKGLYEIIEINGDSRAVFVYYKDFYYLLDEKQSAITKLQPIKDKALISKLKEYRGR